MRYISLELWLAVILLAAPAPTSLSEINQENESIDERIQLKTNDRNSDLHQPTDDNKFSTNINFNKQIKNESFSNSADYLQTNKENESYSESTYMANNSSTTKSNKTELSYGIVNEETSSLSTHNKTIIEGDDHINGTQSLKDITSKPRITKINKSMINLDDHHKTHTDETRSFVLDDKLDTISEVDSSSVENFDKTNDYFENYKKNVENRTNGVTVEQRNIISAVDFGIKALEELVHVREPNLYRMGLYLSDDHPAARVANFGAPRNEKAILMSRIGYATLEASRKIAQYYPENVGRQSAGIPEELQSRIDPDSCPFRGRPRCPPASRRFRTSDGTCNNLEHPWRGSAMLPMQRFLPPVYEDGIQSVRRSVFGDPLPSPRQISTVIHRDKNQEIKSVTLMFTQWGQFIDHDITSTVKSRSFNGSVPRCCDVDGSRMLPPELLHPSCLPIEVSRNDPFLSRFGIGCMEFIRSAPSTRIDCELGWREQINQVTPYIDASTIYGSDVDTSDSIRTFRNGKIIYGRSHQQGPLNPPDPPDFELCTAGALSEECLQPGDARVSENPGLVALHTVFVRYHNKVASVLAKINLHWSDERVFQETRRIVYSVIQHITYREYLPIVLGPEVMDLFELRPLKKGYYDKYDKRVNPSVANSFSTAAFRFGHSMIQNSYIRTDSHHIPLPNNVSLHDEFFNFENIWSIGSVDRLLLGFSNQPSQRRDEFISEELTNHLFQFSENTPGMDLVAINLQRGRDHGIPSYTSWRKPCGLSPITHWRDLEKIMSISSAIRLRTLYLHVDDIDLFTGGLAEKPLRGGVVGPTFACIIAQQFSNLRNGDRFWYENEGFESSLSPAQLQQIRKVSLAQVLCQTMHEIETIQPFVFLSPDNLRNIRVSCDDPEVRNFDLGAWAERGFEFNSLTDDFDSFEQDRSQKDHLNFIARSKRETDNDDTQTSEDDTGVNTTKTGPYILNEQQMINITLISTKQKRNNRSNRKRTKTTTLAPNTVGTKTRKNSTTTRKHISKVTTARPVKLVTSKTESIQLKYDNFNKAPAKPSFTKYSTVKPMKVKGQYYQIKDQNYDDVTYLFGIVPEHSSKSPIQGVPLQVNININYSPQASNPTRPTTNKKKRPNGSNTNSLTNNYATSRPITQGTRRPTDAYGQSDVIVVTKRPNTSTRRPVTYQSEPIFVYGKPDNYDVTTKKSTYYYDNFGFVTTRTKRPNINGYSRPTDVFQRPVTVARPIYYDNNQPSDVPTLFIRPIQTKPATYQTDSYQNNDYYHNNDQKPIYVSSYDSHDRPVYENKPFSSSNSYYYSDSTYNSNRYPSKKPYNSYYFDNDDNTDAIITDSKRRPQFGTYNRDDNIADDDISHEFFDKRGHLDNTDPNPQGSRSKNKGTTNINDKLDFKSRVVYKKTDIGDEDEDRLVQISSVKKEEYFGREGGDGIEETKNVNSKVQRKKKRSLKKIRLVEVDVTPSELRNRWKIFNATDESTPYMETPVLTVNIPCSYEVPKPMTDILPSPNDYHKIREQNEINNN